MYLPVPGSYPREGHGTRSPNTRDRFATIRSRRGATVAATSDATIAASPSSSSATPANPYGARRTHRKVRTGCKKCKERKIKCDEAKPECWQCKRHNVPCDFVNFVNSRPSSVSSASPNANETASVVVAAARSPSVASPGVSPGVSTGEPSAANVGAPAGDGSGGMSIPPDSSAAAAFAFLEWSLNADKDASAAAAGDCQPFSQMPQASVAADPMSTPSPFPSLSVPVACLAAEDDLAMNMTDLSLLHHFTTSTASDLNPWHTGLQEWWTHQVPRVAFRYPFVMRSLLALAGLHVAYLAQQKQQASSPVATGCSSSAAAATGGVPMIGMGSTVGSGSAASPGASYNSPPSTEATTRAFHISRAIEQHKLAGQTASSMLLDLNRSTSAPMYVFSVVTLIISMAMPRQQAAVYSWDITGVLEWTRLMRGVKEIANLSKMWLVEGDMLCGTFDERVLPRSLEREQRERLSMSSASNSPGGGGGGGGGSGGSGGHRDFNFGGSNKRRSRWYLMHEPPLAQMRELVLSGLLEASEGEDLEARQLCVKALDNLQHVFQSFLDHGETVQTARLIFSWLCQVDQRFLDNLSLHNPQCLLLFSYFGVLLHWTDRAWWLEGWGPHIVESISNILGGVDMPARYKEWLRWPREQIGLAPLG